MGTHRCQFCGRRLQDTGASDQTLTIIMSTEGNRISPNKKQHSGGPGKSSFRQFLYIMAVFQFCILLYLLSQSDVSIQEMEEKSRQSLDTDFLLNSKSDVKERQGQRLIPEIHPRPTKEQLERLDQMNQEFATLKKDRRLKPCRWDKGCRASLSFLQRIGFQRRSRILARNTFFHDRYWCGRLIPANGGTVQVDLTHVSCSNPPRIYPKTPTLSAKGMPPINITYNDYGRNTPTKPFPNCSVPCRVGGDWAIVSAVHVAGTPWEITKSMEGPIYYPHIRVLPDQYKRNRYYSVTSFASEIPAPYYSEAEYKLQNPAVDFRKAIKGASFLANNCDSQSHRENVVMELMKTKFRIDSLSACLNNAKPPPGVSDLTNKAKVLQQYLFHLAFENQIEEDYITEKLWGTLAAGTVPVYFGAPNVLDHVPHHSIIRVNDFSSIQELANYLIKVSNDQQLYESYHEWRKVPLEDRFLSRYNFTKTHSNCRACKWAYAMQYGFGWNHSRQEIQDLHIPRQICRNKKGLIGHPFKEYWLSSKRKLSVPVATHQPLKTCDIQDSTRHLTIDDGAFQRTVYTQDGVIDFVIDRGDGKSDNDATYLLRLETPIRSTNLQTKDSNQWWLQDVKSRMTILTSRKMDLPAALNKQGTVEIPITRSHLRIRIISEDVDHFHKGAHKRANYYGNLMTEDFFQPLQVYRML